MSHLYERLEDPCTYFDRRTCNSLEEWQVKTKKSTTVYVGNLNFHTTEEELYELCMKAGSIERIVMGLNRLTKSPCGFAFVVYTHRAEAAAAHALLTGALCDARVIRIDKDTGDEIDGPRKYGRGTSGRQWRDEWRNDFDGGRGGEGGLAGKRMRGEFESYMPAGTGFGDFHQAPVFGNTMGAQRNVRRRRG